MITLRSQFNDKVLAPFEQHLLAARGRKASAASICRPFARSRDYCELYFE
jgi:hypothetical protein